MKSTGYKAYLQPAFLICAAILAAAGGSMSVAIRRFGVYLEKEPLPLRKSLDLLGSGGLGAYVALSKERIVSEDILRELGTEDYIQWLLEDTEASADSPVRKCLLFITYYGLPDRVPHVPEECYSGVGYQRLSSDGVSFEVKQEGRVRHIGGRYVIFSGVESGVWGAETTFPVIYIFRVNGEYAGTREGTRLILGKGILHKHSYFCKIEWKFFNSVFGRTIYPNKADAIAASERLLATILPILESEHWPEWPSPSEE